MLYQLLGISITTVANYSDHCCKLSCPLFFTAVHYRGVMLKLLRITMNTTIGNHPAHCWQFQWPVSRTTIPTVRYYTAHCFKIHITLFGIPITTVGNFNGRYRISLLEILISIVGNFFPLSSISMNSIG